MMAGAKRIYMLIIKVNKLFFLFLSRCFLKEIGNMFSVFLSTVHVVIETLVKVWDNSNLLWKHLPEARVPTAFFVLPNFHMTRVFIT